MNRTDICNLALAYISKNGISSLEDESEEARACRIHYEHDRRRLLLAYTWGFSKRTAKLALLSETVPGWEYLYGYPQQCLSVQFVFDEEHARKREWERQEFEAVMASDYRKAIATNVELAFAEYVQDVTEPEVFSEEFVEALARLLASSMAIELTGSADIQIANLQLAQQCVEAAKYQSAVERERKARYPKKYELARFR